MISRVAITLTLAALSTGCATFTETGAVASVGDQVVSQDDFDSLLAEFAGRSDIFGTTPLADDGTMSADEARVLLGAMVQHAAVSELLAQSEDTVTAADRSAFYDALPADHPWRELSPELLELIANTDSTVIGTALARVSAPNAAAVESMYRDEPATTGMLCLRHILVESEAEADQVIAELEAGYDFAVLAAQRSIEPSASETGGALVSPDSPCITTNQYITGFDPDFTRGAFTAPAERWSDPVESAFGWHVILNRPWSEVGSALTEALTGPLAPSLMLDGLLNSSAVNVDPRYGSWDPATGRIQPVG